MIFTCQFNFFPSYLPLAEENTSKDPPSGSEELRKPVLARPSNPVVPKLLPENNPSSPELRGCKNESCLVENVWLNWVLVPAENVCVFGSKLENEEKDPTLF